MILLYQKTLEQNMPVWRVWKNNVCILIDENVYRPQSQTPGWRRRTVRRMLED
jgi:hypothetical protein